MSTPPPPPKPRTSRLDFLSKLGDVAAEPAPSNFSQPQAGTRAADLNFKVSEEFHRAFKAASSIRGISMKELLEEAFQLWIQKNDLAHVAKDVQAGVVQERSRGRLQRAKPAGGSRRGGARKAEQFPG